MKYPSRYSNGKSITAAQYITELICENKANKDGIDLYYRFWINKKWSKFYRDQIATANKLVKKYSDKAIIRALSDARTKKIFSLRAPHLLPIIEEKQLLLDAENQNLSKELNRTVDSKGRDTKKTNNILDKLRNIDNE